MRAKGGGTVAFPDSTSESTSQLDSKMAPEGSWMCANCNNFSPEKANYCTHCGASGWQTCQLCGSDMKVASQFCPKCGEDVKLAEESVGILLSAKNHANFLEYETAMEEIRDLVKKQNVEATKLSKEWHELVLQRRNLLMEFDSALRVFNLETAVDVAVSLKDMVPAESLSESPDFEVVVKHSELITELRRLLVESATRAHSEYNLAKFTNSIQALNRIFGEDVCGAVNSQLASIHSQLDQALTEAGLALGMNCISRGMDIIGEIPAWKGGDLGDRRTRIYTSCAELLEERDKSIDGIETFIRERRYSDALSMIRQMGRFRLPPDHSEMEPAQADMDAHERIMRIDKVLTKTIDESVSDWIKKDNWEDIQNSLVILEQGESRTWHELLQRLKQATKHELGIRYNKAVEMEQKGRYGAASRAWGDFMHIPKELVPPQYTNQAADFQKRRRLYAIKRARTAVQAATGFCFLLFFLVSSWMTWFPMIKNFVAWDFINDVLPNPLFPPGTQLDHMSGMTPAFIQFGLFAILAAVAGTRLLHVAPNHLDRFSTSPRLILMGFLLAISPVSMAAYEAFYHQVYVPRLVPGIAHPALVLLVVWLLLDWLRGSTLKRVPANFALSLSWLVVVPFVIGAERFGPDVVERLDVLYPSEATLLQPWKWPVLAMTHGGIYLVVVLVEHIIYVKRHGGGVNGGAVTDKTATSLGISTDTSIDFK